MMLYLFPTPYPDELVYSVFSRYHIRVGSFTFQHTQKGLFGEPNRRVYRLGLPTNLATLVNRWVYGQNSTLNQLLMEHTLFPYYRTFLTYREVKQLWELMEGTKGKSLAVVVRIPELQLYN